jgi:hypothetical protein
MRHFAQEMRAPSAKRYESFFDRQRPELRMNVKNAGYQSFIDPPEQSFNVGKLNKKAL